MGQIAAFLVPVFGVPWTLVLVLRLVGADGEPWTVLAWILPTVWAPTIVALTLTRLTGGPGAARAAVRARLSYRRGSGPWLLVAGAAPLLATAAAVAVARAAGDASPFIPSTALPAMLVVQFVTGAVGEELGWRGFLLPRLEKRFSTVTAAWVMAILWSVWHVSAFFVYGMPHQAMPPVSTLFSIALFGLFLAVVFNRSGGSVLATMIAHLSLNIASGFGGVPLSSIVYWRTLSAIIGALVVIIILASRTLPPEHP